MGFPFSVSVHFRALCVHLVAPSDGELTDGRNYPPLPSGTFPLASGTGPTQVQLRWLVPQSRNVLLGWDARSVSSGRGSTVKREARTVHLSQTDRPTGTCPPPAYSVHTPTGMGHVGP